MRAGRVVGGVLVALAVVLLAVTYHALAAPVVTGDGGRCASVWTVHRTQGRTTGGFMSDAERQAGADRCATAGEPGWRRAVVLASATGGTVVAGAVVLHRANRRRPSRPPRRT